MPMRNENLWWSKSVADSDLYHACMRIPKINVLSLQKISIDAWNGENRE